MPIEEFAPEYDVRSHHAIGVDAPPELVYRALRTANLAESAVARALLSLRALAAKSEVSPSDDPAAVARRAVIDAQADERITLEGALRRGFVILSDRPGEELVLGTVGDFWSLAPRTRKLTRQKFRQYAEPGAAKAAWSFTITPRPGGGSVLVTETRVVCANAADRARFRWYWMAIAPFSGLIRRAMLTLVKQRAESLARYRIYETIA